FCMGITPSDLALTGPCIGSMPPRGKAAPPLGHADMGLEPGRVVGERGAVALIDDAAAVEDDGPIGKPEDLARLLLDDDGGETLLANDVAEHAEQLLD